MTKKKSKLENKRGTAERQRKYKKTKTKYEQDRKK